MSRFEFLMDEVDKKVQELRSQKARAVQSGDSAFEYDPLSVRDQDPGYVYKGVNRKPERVERFKSFGYELVPQVDTAQWNVTTTQKDGAKAHGDLVLMRIPKDKWVERMAKVVHRQSVRDHTFIEERKENIDRIMRNEARAPAHSPTFVEDTSIQGETETAIVRRTPRVPAGGK